MCLIFNFISFLLGKTKLFSMATCHMITSDPCSGPNEYWWALEKPLGRQKMSTSDPSVWLIDPYFFQNEYSKPLLGTKSEYWPFETIPFDIIMRVLYNPSTSVWNPSRPKWHIQDIQRWKLWYFLIVCAWREGLYVELFWLVLSVSSEQSTKFGIWDDQQRMCSFKAISQIMCFSKIFPLPNKNTTNRK